MHVSLTNGWKSTGSTLKIMLGIFIQICCDLGSCICTVNFRLIQHVFPIRHIPTKKPFNIHCIIYNQTEHWFIYLIPPSKSPNLSGPLRLISSSLTPPKIFHHENIPPIKQQWPWSSTDWTEYSALLIDKAGRRHWDPRMWVITICRYSRSPLIWHQWDRKGAGISNILDYQTLITLT